MLKKFFTGLMAAALLFTTSCEHQDMTPTVGGEVTVSVNVSTPEISTRAYSDGMTANKLQYAVYHIKSNTQGAIGVKDIQGTTSLDFQLTAGEEYEIILWAAKDGAPYTVDFTNKTMTVDYAQAVCNDESRDAFYKRHTFTVNGAQTETVTLTRPFAQLNIGTNDYEAAETASGYEPTKSSVKVKGIYNTLNLANGKVSGGDDAYVHFASAPIPTRESFPVTGYDYVAMNYVLVGADKSLVDVEFTISDNNKNNKTRTVTSVPVQRNYRTNIYGSILTSDVDVNVEIKPGYNEPAHEVDALLYAAQNGGTVTLTEDVVLTSPLEVVGDMTINLNGKTVSGNMHKSVGPVIKNNGTLTINGGTISSRANNGGSAIANYGTLTVEDVTINGAPREGDSWPAYPINNYGSMTLTDAVISGYQGCVALNAAGTTVLNNCVLTKNYVKTSSHVFYVNHADAKVFVNGGIYNHNGFDGSLAYVNKGEVTINDGTFNAKDGGYGFAVMSGGKVIINGGNINAGLMNWGGQFEVYGGTFNQNPSKFLAPGHYALPYEAGKYTVYAIDAASRTLTINNKEEFLKLNVLNEKWAEFFSDGKGTDYSNYAVANGGKGTDFYYKWEWTIKLNADIDFEGATLNAPINMAGFGRFDGQNHTIKNVTIENDTKAGLFSSSGYGALKNIKLDKVHAIGGYNGNSTVGILASDCSAGVDNITITNSTAVGGKYTGGVVGYGYTYVTNCTLTNCVVEGGYKCGGVIGYICASNANGHNVTGNTLTNCTVEAAPEHADNKLEYVLGMVVGNYNCNGTCANNVVYDMTTTATMIVGKIEAGKVVNESNNVVTYVVENYDELKAAVINGGNIEFANDITVDEWIMFSEDLNISNGTIITIDEINVTIDGKGHTLTVNAIESAGNNDQLFQGASNLNISNLTIKYADGLTTGGLGMVSGVINDVHFVGGGAAASSAAIFPGNGVIKVEDCIFDTNGVAIYFDDDRDNLTVTGCTFNMKDTKNVILLRGDVKFSGNTVNSGRTVNVVNGSPVVTGNDFKNVRFKVYGAATATISENIINNLEFDGTTYASTFTNNTLSEAAQAVLDAATKVN